MVAADDQVMPQTIEAISHARNAGVPIVVAVNKIDLPAANAVKVKQDLLQQNVVVEEFGGEVLSQEISAKKGTNVGELWYGRAHAAGPPGGVEELEVWAKGALQVKLSSIATCSSASKTCLLCR